MSELAPELTPLGGPGYQAYNTQSQQFGAHTQALVAGVAALALGLGGVRAEANGVAAGFQQMTAPMVAATRVTHQSVTQLTGDVRGLTRTFPESRQEAYATVRAVQALGLTAAGQEKQVASLATTITKLSGATGEAPAALAMGFGQLTREMASLDPRRVANMADVLTTMSARSGTAPSSITEFAKAIGPMAQQAGVGETSVLGIATSFAKLGDDGYVAANTVSKMFDDLNRSVRDGSNDMAGYANAVGMTIDQFKSLYRADPAGAIARVTQAVGQMPAGQGTRVLEQLGITSPRAQRAFLEQAQSGGMMADIQAARAAYGSGSTNQAAAAGFSTVQSSLMRLGNAADDVAVTFERPLLNAANSIISLAGGATRGIGTVLRSGPVGTAVDIAGQAALPLLAARLGYRAISTGALANFVMRSGPVSGFFGGVRIGRQGGLDEAIANPARSRAVQDMLLAAQAGAPLGTNDFRAGLNQRMLGLGTAVGTVFAPGAEAGPSIFRRAFGTGVVGAGLTMRAQAEFLRLSRLGPLERDNYLMRTYGGAGETAAGNVRALSEAHAAGTIGHAEFARGLGKEAVGLVDESSKATTAIRSLSLGVKDLGIQTVLTGGAMAKQAGGGLLKGLGGFLTSGAGIATIGLGAAYGGYQLYENSRAQQRAQDARVQGLTGFDTVNAYRDAMGKAGEATISLSDQMTAASQTMLLAVSNFHDAARVSSADYAAANRNKNITSYFSGNASQVGAQISALNLGGLQPSDVQGAKLDLLRMQQQGLLPAGFDINSALSGVRPNSSQSLGGSQISDIVTGMSKAPGLGHVGFGFTTLERMFGGRWTDVGRTGGGAPQLGKIAGGELLNFQDALMQERQNLGHKYGDKYAAGREIQDMDKAMAAAIKTHNADLVVGMEQQFTQQLTGKTIHGASAHDVATSGGFIGFLRKHNVSVDQTSLDALLGSTAKGIPPAQEDVLSTSLQNQVGRIGEFFSNFSAGAMNPGRRALAAAAAQPDDLQKQHDAAMAVVDSGQRAGMTLGELASQAAKSTASMADGDARRAVMVQVIAEATRQLQNSLGGMTFGQQIGAQANFAAQLAGTTGNSQEAQQARAQGQDTATQVLNTERGYMQQRLQAQYDYEKQSYRANRDFQRQMAYSQEDFARQTARAAQDAAANMYDPYQRIAVQPVFDAANLQGNVAEQIQAMRQQVTNINQLRRLGLSEDAIRFLKLYDPRNAQQVAQLATDLQSDHSEVGQFNQDAQVRQRLGRQLLTQDPAFRRNQQDFQIAMSRQKVAFTTQMADAHTDLMDGDRQMTGDLAGLQADMLKLMHGQQVDWTTQLVNGLDQTIHIIKKKTPQLLAAQQGALYSGGGGGGGANLQTPGLGYGAGNRQFTGSPDTGSGAPTYRMYGPGPNAGILATSASRPGTDMNTFGNPKPGWGTNVALAPDNRRLKPNAKLAQQMAAKYGWDTGVEWSALYDVWDAESGFGTTAGRPQAAYGIPQADPGNKMASFGKDWLSNPRTQIGWGLDYVWRAYGDPLGAWGHKRRTGWYGDGGIAMGPHIGVVAEKGVPEAMIPLNSQGIGKLAAALRSYLTPTDAASLRGGGSYYAMHIDNSTHHYDQRLDMRNSTVEVKADDPRAMQRALEAKTKLDNLTGTRGVAWQAS